MPKAPPRWLDLHPGDMVFERMTTVAAVQQACKEMAPLGYQFMWADHGDHFFVVCIKSPRPLIGQPNPVREDKP